MKITTIEFALIVIYAAYKQKAEDLFDVPLNYRRAIRWLLLDLQSRDTLQKFQFN